jgi:hypothetical protein
MVSLAESFRSSEMKKERGEKRKMLRGILLGTFLLLFLQLRWLQ